MEATALAIASDQRRVVLSRYLSTQEPADWEKVIELVVGEKPNELHVDDYRNAPGGEGPLAGEWDDKPHRLIYDLCREVNRLRADRLSTAALLSDTANLCNTFSEDIHIFEDCKLTPEGKAKRQTAILSILERIKARES